MWHSPLQHSSPGHCFLQVSPAVSTMHPRTPLPAMSYVTALWCAAAALRAIDISAPSVSALRVVILRIHKRGRYIIYITESETRAFVGVHGSRSADETAKVRQKFNEVHTWAARVGRSGHRGGRLCTTHGNIFAAIIRLRNEDIDIAIMRQRVACVVELHGSGNHGLCMTGVSQNLAQADAGDDERERDTLVEDRNVRKGRYRRFVIRTMSGERMALVTKTRLDFARNVTRLKITPMV